MKKVVASLFIIGLSFSGLAQDNESNSSNILEYTPSKLLKKGDWDFKLFNNLYTQTKRDEGGNTISGNRENYFTTTIETYTGVSENSRVNVGLIVSLKSNTFDKSATSVFSFGNNKSDSRSGIASIAPSIKVQPFRSISNFSIQSSFHIPVFDDQPQSYLDKRSYVWETKFFYDRTFGNNKFQFFGEVDFAYNFGEKGEDASVDENRGERFANNSLGVPVSVFFSYFPTNKFTVYANAQHYQLIDLGNDFSQNYSLVGLGVKYQLTSALNLELSSAKFFRAKDAGLGQTFNLGLRYLLTK